MTLGFKGFSVNCVLWLLIFLPLVYSPSKEDSSELAKPREKTPDRKSSQISSAKFHQKLTFEANGEWNLTSHKNGGALGKLCFNMNANQSIILAICLARFLQVADCNCKILASHGLQLQDSCKPRIAIASFLQVTDCNCKILASHGLQLQDSGNISYGTCKNFASFD